MLVEHSYGGKVITEMGDLPNVKSLVYIAAFAPDAVESAGALSHAMPPAGIDSITPDSDGYLWVAQDKYHANFCQDLSKEEANIMAITQKAPIASTFGDTVTAPAWKVKPSYYQVSTQDRMIHPDNQRMMAQRMNAKKVIELDASHASLASQAQAVVALIVEASQA